MRAGSDPWITGSETLPRIAAGFPKGGAESPLVLPRILITAGLRGLRPRTRPCRFSSTFETCIYTLMLHRSARLAPPGTSTAGTTPVPPAPLEAGREDPRAVNVGRSPDRHRRGLTRTCVSRVSLFRLPPSQVGPCPRRPARELTKGGRTPIAGRAPRSGRAGGINRTPPRQSWVTWRATHCASAHDVISNGGWRPPCGLR
jgi:hypothetical protein